MAILETCCYWKNVRRGSYACGVYTLIYFSLSTLMFSIYLKEEQDFLLGQRPRPVGESMLEKGEITPVTVIFNIVFWFCSVLMIFASMLLIIGLRFNKRYFLLPWIGLMLCDLLIECGHLIQLMVGRRVKFDPVVGFIFTIDFFILCLNLYCLLCVISQYQLYRTERSEQQPPLSPTVVVKAPEKIKKTQEAATLQPQASKRQQRRHPEVSSLVTSQRSHFSTIREEEEQQNKCKLTVTAV